MTTVEAAQAWAQAKDKLGAATAALETAQAEYIATLEAERDAWLAMAGLAGRVQPDKMTVEKVAEWPPTPSASRGAHYRFDDGFKG